MAVACPVGFDVARLKEEIRLTYASVARDPGEDFHFHRGADYAARLLGYDLIELKSLPRVATAPFAGVGNPFLMERLPTGAVVLDIGSGGGNGLPACWQAHRSERKGCRHRYDR